VERERVAKESGPPRECYKPETADDTECFYDFWQMREFHLSSVSNVLGLRIVTTALTPADSAVNTGTPENTALVNYINGQSVLIHGG
jgi:hypothetical protein